MTDPGLDAVAHARRRAAAAALSGGTSPPERVHAGAGQGEHARQSNLSGAPTMKLPTACTAAIRPRPLPRTRVCLTLPILALLGACATPYQPHDEAQAAKVRIRLERGPLLATLVSNVRPIQAGRCGAPTVLPAVRPYAGPPPAQVGPQSTQAPPTYPRVGMFGGDDPQRSDNVELQLPPGRQMFMLALVAGTAQCRVEVAFELEARRQYQVHYVFDTAYRRCRAHATRLDDSSTPPRWVPQPYAPEQSCSAA